MRNPTSLPTLLLALALPLAAGAQGSQIELDGSLPNGRTDLLTGPGLGPDYTIGEDLGHRAGPNLFHSFLRFSIATGESATFTADAGLPQLSNVIARVTGGEASAIDGTLRSEISGAHFFLLNPSGVLFGGNSSLDMAGSFTVGTPHQLGFAGTPAVLDLLDRDAPELRVEAPESFGFLEGGPRAEVLFSDPAGEFAVREYLVPQGETLRAVGGDVTLQQRVRLRASSGNIQLAAVGDAADTLPIELADYDPAQAQGVVTVTGRSEVLTVANRTSPQGTVVVRGGRLVLEGGSVVRAGDFVGGDGASIDVGTAERVEVTGASLLRADSLGDRPSGGVRIVTPELEVSSGSLVQTRIDLDQAAGDLVVEADRVTLSEGGILGTLTRRTGSAGAVRIDAETLDIEDGEIQSLAISDARGGDLVLRTGTLRLVDGRVGTQSGTRSGAGSIDIESDRIEISGGTSAISTSKRSSVVNLGASGDIRIATPADGGSLRVLDGALVSAETLGVDPSGSISIETGELAVLGGGIDSGGDPRASAIQTGTLAGGRSGTLSIVADSVELASAEGSDFGGLLTAFVSAGATGEGGVRGADGALRAIDLQTRTLTIRDGAQISTSTFGDGAAGNIDARASESVAIRGRTTIDGTPTPSGLFSRSETAQDAGDITLVSPEIVIEDGAELSTRGTASGAAGKLRLTASRLLRVGGRGGRSSVVTARVLDGVEADPRERGIDIVTGKLEVLDGSLIDVSTSGSGPGGRLSIAAGSVRVEGSDANGFAASLGAQADASGNADGVSIFARDLEVGRGGEITALTRGLGGNAGDVTVLANTILVEGRVTAEAGAGGAGGSIDLEASDSLRVRGGEITVRSQDVGDAGSLRLAAGRLFARDAVIRADAEGFGGDIEIFASRQVHFVDTQLIAESRGGANAMGLAGGNIEIDPPAVVLNNSTITANGFGNADGGNVFIAANPLLVSGDSQITASSEFGTSGTIAITPPSSEITGDLAALPSSFLDASALFVEACLARDEVAGSFTVRATGELSPPPDAPLPPDLGAPGAACEPPPL